MNLEFIDPLPDCKATDLNGTNGKNVFIVDTNLRPLILIRSATRLANLLIVIVGWSALLSNKISYEAVPIETNAEAQEINVFMNTNVNI